MRAELSFDFKWVRVPNADASAVKQMPHSFIVRTNTIDWIEQMMSCSKPIDYSTRRMGDDHLLQGIPWNEYQFTNTDK